MRPWRQGKSKELAERGQEKIDFYPTFTARSSDSSRHRCGLHLALAPCLGPPRRLAGQAPVPSVTPPNPGCGYAGAATDDRTPLTRMQTVTRHKPGPDNAQPRGFRLTRFYTLATLGVFLAAGLALWYLQRAEEEYFEKSQREQLAMFTQSQADLAREQQEAARADLLALQEATHVSLTRVVANTLWDSDIAHLVAQAQRHSVDACRAAGEGEPRRGCLAELGRKIRALPGFSALDAKAYATMRQTVVFKMKVWDLRGVAVYSSEHAQIGDDGSANQGWRLAVQGKPASELTHRDRFSAFEGVVENRDLISTYVPVKDPQTGQVLGVFELYSDVTPFLDQGREQARRFAQIASTNEARVHAAARRKFQTVTESSEHFLLIVGGLLALLYAASLLIVRLGQRIIDQQTLEQEQAARREQLWHREKMAALSTMAANVSHEVGNPLAVIVGVAQQLPLADEPPDSPGRTACSRILEQTARISQMMRRISDFSAARSSAPEWVDINATLRSICEFLAFDKRFRSLPLTFEPGSDVPAREIVPDHLNEVMMHLLQTCAEAGDGAAVGRRIVVRTRSLPGAVEISLQSLALNDRSGEVPCPCLTGARRDLLQQRMAAMGGTLDLQDAQGRILLADPAPPYTK